MHKALELRNVSVRFGKLQALDGMTLSAKAGSVLMLAGPNGAGKSTLIRVLLGLVTPNAGSLFVDGVQTAVDARFRERLGYLPESVAFSEVLSGREVVSFFASARGVAKARVATVLTRVGLESAAKRPVRDYSRGMRQRLGLAVALVSEPEVLVLDEPTGGLDQDGLVVLWSVLDEWRRAGRVVILASHEIALLEHRVDRLALLASGRLVAEGTPSELRRSARLPLRVHLELDDGASAELDAFVDSVGEVTGEAPIRADFGLEVAVAPDRLLSLLDLRAKFPGAVRDLRVQEPPFDEVYRQLLVEAA